MTRRLGPSIFVTVNVACVLAVAMGLTMPTPASATTTLTLTAPVDGATVGGPGGPLAVWQLASVPPETTQVNIFLDQTLADRQTWEAFPGFGLTKGYIPDANGTHTFHLEVYAGATLLGSTVPITILIDNEWPVSLPVVSLTSPAPNASLSGIITLSANATDTASGVQWVAFYADGGVALGKTSTAPYTVNFDTTLLPDGRYHVMAQVMDKVGWENYSDTVIVTLTNGLATKTEWSKVIGGMNMFGPNQQEDIGDLAVNPQDGGLLVTGYAGYPATNFGGSTITGNASYMYLAKYDELGIYQWLKQFGYNQMEMRGRAVGLDASGNILLTANGGFSQYQFPQLDFGCGPVAEPPGGTNFQLVIAKLSPTGACLWSKASGVGDNPPADFAIAGWRIAADPGGNVIVGGQYSSGTFGGGTGPDFGGGPLPTARVSNEQGFLVKYSPTGVHLWSKGLGEFSATDTQQTGGVWILDVAVDAQGNVYATGAFAGGRVDFGGTILTAAPEPQIGDGDSFLAKYSPTGALVWVKQFVGGIGPDSGTGVAVDAGGNAYVTGSFSGSVNVSGQLFTSLGSRDIFAASFSPGGSLRWARAWGGTGQERGAHVTIAPDGHLLMSLAFEESLDTGGAGVVTKTGVLSLSDVLVMQLDALNGATLNARTYGGTSSDQAPRLASDRASRPVLGGRLTSAFSVAGENQQPHSGIRLTANGANSNGGDMLLVNMAIGGFFGDTNPPQVGCSITPMVSGTVTGTIQISAAASDNVGVTRVEFFKDSDATPFYTGTTLSSQTSFNTFLIPNGLHTFKVTAYDAANNKATAALSVMVNNVDVAPTVTITQPAPGAILSGITGVSATITDSDATGVERAEFYVDGTLKATDTTSPYYVNWDTRTAVNGDHTLLVKAYDTATIPNIGISSPVTVTVTNNHAPTVNAGPDQSMTLPAAANLDGTVTDDGLPSGGTLTTTWSKFSGPGTVTFGNSALVDTTASFSTSGSYSLKLLASDGSLSASDYVTVTVNPVPIVTYTLTLATAGTGSGTVTKNPDQASYAPGTVVTLTAAPAVSSLFSGWSGALTGAVNPTTLTMDANKSVTATFTLKTFTLTASAGTGGTISPSGAVIVPYGGSQTFTIAPASGYQIASVLVNGVNQGAISTYTFSNVTANHTISASFSLLPTTDTTAPTVNLTTPANGALVPKNTTITLEASATDNVGVTKVEFYVNGRLKGTDLSSPYTYPWQTPGKAGKSATLQAKAYDAAGNVGRSALVTVTAQ